MKNKYKDTDQKWGWIIVFAIVSTRDTLMLLGFVLSICGFSPTGNIIVFLVLGGLIRSFGIFVVPIQKAFDVNAATVGSIVTVRAVGGMISVLTAPALSERFTERKVVITASIINIIGPLLIFFVNHIISFYAWAIIFGISLGYSYIPTQVIIGKYFQKRRSLALSICSSGATLGQLILPPLYAFLMDKYDLFGTFLIVGGISLNCIAAAALQRPFNAQSVARQNGDDEDDVMNGGNALTRQSTSREGRYEGGLATGQYSEVEPFGEIYDANVKGTEIGRECEDKIIPTIKDEHATLPDSSECVSGLGNNKTNDTLSRVEHVDIISIPRVDNINVTTLEYAHRGVELEEDPQTVPCSKNSTSTYQQTKRFLQRQFDVSLLKLPRFIIVVLINATTYGFLLGPKMFLIAMAKERGVVGELSLLLTVNACTDFLGRFIIAMIIDTKIVQTHHVVLLCNLLSAVATCSYPLAQQYWSMMVVSAIMGLSSSTCGSMALPVVVELVGVQRMSKGLGWHTFALAIAAQTLLPLLGMIRDVTGSYDAVYYISGACISGVVLAYFIGNFIIEHTVRKVTQPTEKEMNDETKHMHLTETGETMQENT